MESPGLRGQVRFTRVEPWTPQDMSGDEREEMKSVVVEGFMSMRMQVPSPWVLELMKRVVKRVWAVVRSGRDRRERDRERREMWCMVADEVENA